MFDDKGNFMTSTKIRCLYCDEPYDFISGTHIKTHFGDVENSFERFKDWVAQTYDLDRDHEVFQTPGALTRRDTHREYKHLFDR